MRSKILFVLYLMCVPLVQGQVPLTDSVAYEGCAPDTISFTYDSANPSDYYWQFGNGDTSTQKEPTVRYDSAGRYTVTLITDGTDTIRRTDFVILYSFPDPGFSYTDTATVGTFSIDFKSHIRFYDSTDMIWWFGDGTVDTTQTSRIVHKYSKPNTYMVRVKNSIGCEAKRSVKVIDALEIPNVFTPNNDGINELFKITSNGESQLSIRIYDRWGNLIYKHTARTIIWDGRTTSGIKAKPGIYFYVVKVKQEDEIAQKKEGFFHLYRD